MLNPQKHRPSSLVIFLDPKISERQNLTVILSNVPLDREQTRRTALYFFPLKKSQGPEYNKILASEAYASQGS